MSNRKKTYDPDFEANPEFEQDPGFLEGVCLPDAKRSSDFFGNDNSPQIIDSSYNA